MDSAKTKQYIDKHFDAAFLDPLKVYDLDWRRLETLNPVFGSGW